MAGAHDSTDVPEDSTDLRQQPFAFDRVRLHDRPLVLRQLARLVDDLGGNLDLADVVEQCREFGIPALARVEPDPVCDLEDKAHHVAAVAPRVRIVRFDDVSEEHGCAPIRVAELERVVDADLPLASKIREQPDHRQGEDHERRMGAAAERGEKCDRGECRVESPDPEHEAEQAQRRDSEAQTVPQSRAPEVEHELRAECEGVDRQMPQRRRGLSGRDEDERWADRMP